MLVKINKQRSEKLYKYRPKGLGSVIFPSRMNDLNPNSKSPLKRSSSWCDIPSLPPLFYECANVLMQR